MAENKKSFILYADFIGTFEDLSDEEAGKLIKHVFRYVNDLNPVTDDKLVKIAFGPIKQQLKRDLVKYEKTKVRKSEAGKKGMDARWQKEKSITEHNSVINVITEHNSVIGAITPITVTDTVTVNDTVINKKDFALIFPHGSEEFLKLWADWVQYRKDIKKPYQTFSSQQIELQTLGTYPEKDAIQMIKNAIKNSWKNIRPLELLPTTQANQPVTTPLKFRND